MEIVHQKEFLKSFVQGWERQGKSVGFVPTMGALHEGHLHLVRKARAENEIVVVSIFVNPLQFNNADDLKKYPRNLSRDQEMLEKEGIDLLFAPEADGFYSSKALIAIDFGTVSSGLEGQMRPGHFSGVGIVLARLFHLLSPRKAYFGAKDLQQVAVVRALVRDLDFQLEVVRCPTHREESGLAMSSRNTRLSDSGKQTAAHLYQALQLAASEAGGDLQKGKTKAMDFLSRFPQITIEYLEWVDCNTMEILAAHPAQSQEKAICIAAWLEGVRLIDNLIVD